MNTGMARVLIVRDEEQLLELVQEIFSDLTWN